MKTCECRGRAEYCDSQQGCICFPQWSGEFCTVDVDECQTPDSCPMGQICTNTNGSFTCTCPVGFEKGTDGVCTDINECDAISVHQCPQHCQNSHGSFACYCDKGYEYNTTDNSCDDIDECAVMTSGCEHLCVNRIGDFVCDCFAGYVLGDDGKTCVRVKDLYIDSDLECDYSCTLLDSKPTCICPIGFFLGTDGASCVDIDECNSPLSEPCSDMCVNTNGSYTCSCPSGKVLANDQRTCIDCDAFHWGDNCANECSCNPLGSSSCNSVTGCMCRQGWGGVTCHDDINECNSVTSPCPALSDCTNTAGSFVCQCQSGYQLNRTNQCENINECFNNPCDQMCSDTVGGYECRCSPGFRVEGNHCINIDECKHPRVHKCKHVCRDTIGSFACECHEGFLLNTSSPDRNTCYWDPTFSACKKNLCSGGFCTHVRGQDICVCHAGYELDSSGHHCQDMNECQTTNPCQGPGSSCVNSPSGSFTCSCSQAGYQLARDKVTCVACLPNRFGLNCTQTCKCNSATTQFCNSSTGECVCASGWTGSDCATDVDECRGPGAVDCGPNSKCVNGDGSYWCQCDTGFVFHESKCQACSSNTFGTDCSSTCTCIGENTQDCDDTTGHCVCRPGYRGNICQIDVNECRENPNFCPSPLETCNNLPGSAKCVCILGYTKIDDVCEDNNECVDGTSDCAAPSVCINTPGGFECVCPQEYQQSNGHCLSPDDNFPASLPIPSISSTSRDDDDDDSNMAVATGLGISAFVILCIIVCAASYWYVRKRKSSFQNPISVNSKKNIPHSLFTNQSDTKMDWNSCHRFKTKSPPYTRFSDDTSCSSRIDGRLHEPHNKVQPQFRDSPLYSNIGYTFPMQPPRDAASHATLGHHEAQDRQKT